MKKLPFLLFLLPFVLVTPMLGQGVLHLIVSCDDQNADIRQGCQKDFDKTSAFFKELANDAGMGFQQHQLTFNRDEVYRFFEGFQCAPDDAVIFFYSGHGFRKEDDMVIWPLMYYCTASQSSASQNPFNCAVPLDWIHQMLISKHPRMSITLGNSCNTLPGQEEGIVGAEGLEKKEDDQSDGQKMLNLNLLTTYSGHILASGASPGQFAYTNEESGSYFVNELVEVLADGLLFADHPTTWASMLKKTREAVQKKKADQRPQFLIVEDQKKMYSEGKARYQKATSAEVLKLAVPETGEQNYNDWEVEEFSSDDFAQGWEQEFDAEENLEMALEDLPLILLYGVQIDDGNISADESQKAFSYYLGLMNTYDYDPESAKLTFEGSVEELHEEQADGTFSQILDLAVQEFRTLQPGVKSAILAQMANLSEHPESPKFQSFLQKLNK